MISDLFFPQSPPIIAEWQPIFLEPIVNSGERITVLIIIKNQKNEVTINRAIDEPILKLLYGKSSSHIIGLIEYLEKSIKNPLNWDIPFEGVYLGPWSTATDFSLEGVLLQALTLSSSLSVKGGNNNEITPKIPLIDSNKWFHDVKALVTQSNPLLTTNFNRSISIARNITYDYDFSFNSFVANFLDFRNLHKQKAQTSIFKMQMLSKNIDIKMKNIILQMPTKIDLNTMSSQNIEVLHERVTIFSSFLLEHDVELLKVETAEQASKKILRIAS